MVSCKNIYFVISTAYLTHLKLILVSYGMEGEKSKFFQTHNFVVKYFINSVILQEFVEYLLGMKHCATL